MTHIAQSYAGLPVIDDVTPLDNSDEACMEEIRDVLKRHRKLDRFGLTLLHQHFPVNEGEILVETCNPKTRELYMCTVLKSEVDNTSVVETSWRLSDSGAMTKCQTKCQTGRDGKHWQLHQQNNCRQTGSRAGQSKCFDSTKEDSSYVASTFVWILIH